MEIVFFINTISSDDYTVFQALGHFAAHDLQNQGQWGNLPLNLTAPEKAKFYALTKNMQRVYRHAWPLLTDSEKAHIKRDQPDVLTDSTGFRAHGEEMNSLVLKWGNSLMIKVNKY